MWQRKLDHPKRCLHIDRPQCVEPVFGESFEPGGVDDPRIVDETGQGSESLDGCADPLGVGAGFGRVVAMAQHPVVIATLH